MAATAAACDAVESPAHAPGIGFGYVWHTRLRPRRHHFRLRTYFLLLPMRTLGRCPQRAGVLAMNRSAALAYWDADHGDGRGAHQGGALAWLQELLQREGIQDATGEIWLQCFPRVLGYAFKPVSFWYCERADGSLSAVVAEVNNTFGERHVYVLPRASYGCALHADKAFHVSPFCPVQGRYRFSFLRGTAPGLDNTRVRIDYHDDQGPVLLTGIEGRVQPLDEASRRHALWAYPLLSLGVMARILWHAVRLCLKQVPLHARPAASAAPGSSSHPPRPRP